MAQNFQSSFIPKDPTTPEVFKKERSGILGSVALLLLIVSIVASIGLYFYKGILKGEINNLQSELETAEENIDKKTINEMSAFSKKLELAQSIVNRHKVISNFMATLSSSTVNSVQFMDMSYNSTDNKLEVMLKGKANSYATVALQESVLFQNKNLKSVKFSNLNLDEDGAVSFDLSVLVDPQISTYSP